MNLNNLIKCIKISMVIKHFYVDISLDPSIIVCLLADVPSNVTLTGLFMLYGFDVVPVISRLVKKSSPTFVHLPQITLGKR